MVDRKPGYVYLIQTPRTSSYDRVPNNVYKIGKMKVWVNIV